MQRQPPGTDAPSQPKPAAPYTAWNWVQLFLLFTGTAACIWYRVPLFRFMTAHVLLAAGLFHVIVGGSILLAGMAVGIRLFRFFQVAERVVAEVVSVDETMDRDSESDAEHMLYTPIVRFLTVDGAEVRTALRFRSTYMTNTPMPIGAKVTMLYDRAKPSRAVMDNLTKWQPVVIYLIFGGAAAGVGCIILASSAAR